LPELDDLAGFKEALLEQHKERCLVLKRSVDEDLADMITARRLQVERIVHNLGRSREKRLNEGLKANRRRIELQKKAYTIELQDSLIEFLEEKVRARLEAFRCSPRYGDAMKALLAQARGLMPLSIVWVEKGDSVFLKPDGSVLEVREGLKDVWGGLLIEEKESGRLVDNTFRTRWHRLRPFFIAEHEEVFTELFQ
jgi:vacuolar-type H+-ATPase subunit E/Vma4